MADIELPAKDAPDYKEKLSEKRRALMAITRQKKKDNADVKKENHRQQVEQNKINRAKDLQEFKEWRKNKGKNEDKLNAEIVNEDNEDNQNDEDNDEEEIEEVKPKKIVKEKVEKVIKEKLKAKPKPKKQVIIEESESESESDEEEVIVVKKKKAPKKKEPKVIYVTGREYEEPPPIKRQPRQPRQPTIKEEEPQPPPEKIDYSKYFTLR